MIQLFVAKLRQEENQDSIEKALKDIALMRFSMAVKYIIRYVGLFLLSLFALVAFVALPIIAVIAIIYNSPFAIFFPSISSGETTQDVLSAYVARGTDPYTLYIKSPEGTIASYSGPMSSTTFTTHDFDGENPKGTWKVWIVNSGVSYNGNIIPTSTVTVSLTVYYDY